MKAFSTLVPAALAVSLCAATLPAHAATIAQFSPLSGNSDFKWVQSASGTGGHLFSINKGSDTAKQGVATAFMFLDPALAGLGFLPATFTIDATVADGNAATFNTASNTFTQNGLNGSFSLTFAGDDTTIDGIKLTKGENLLSGIFTGAWIQGFNGSGSINLSAGPGVTSVFSSALRDFSNTVDGSEGFALNLSANGFHATKDKSLDDLQGNGGGNFTADSAGVPEPATWGLMIVGFGGIGALMRSKRRRVAGALA
jgi:hypothetical protein